MTENEYKKQTEPSMPYKSYIWKTAIGLQAVDGLKPSKYLIATANKNIKGEISIDEAEKLINTYYAENPKKNDKNRTEEADKVSARIAKILSQKTFNFTSDEMLSIHKKLFKGIYKHAGKIRKYNITKSEWVLDGDTIMYGDADQLLSTLNYDLSEEKKFNYTGISDKALIKHLSKFISALWQNHIFEEGNTRTTAVFFIKYLRKLGFDVANDIFEENAWYFRNALVRANYNNRPMKVSENTEFLEKFLENLLFGKKHKLSNRVMHISGKFKKANIQKANIGITKTSEHVNDLYKAFGTSKVFGRTVAAKVTGLKATRLSELFGILLDKKIIIKVEGQGKGKYRFVRNSEK